MSTTLWTMAVDYAINTDFSNHKIVGCLSSYRATTSSRRKTATKRRTNLRKLEEDVRASTYLLTT